MPGSTISTGSTTSTSGASLGQWLREQRRMLRLTQEELAGRTGCSLETIRKLEGDTRRPSKHLAAQLAQSLGLPVDEHQAFIQFARGQMPEVHFQPIQPIQPIQRSHPSAPSLPPLRSEPALSSARAPSGSSGLPGPREALPLQLSSFIGREREMAEIKRLLSTSRLLSLTGAGGAGKTRLSLQVASGLLDEYPDGVWFVDLAAIADPALVPQQVASALAVREQPGRTLMETLVDYLRPRESLLLLDNCEHMVSTSALLADTLLRACLGLRILATSRQALGIPGEMVWRVPSLSLPPSLPAPGHSDEPGDQQIAVDSLSQYEAVQLFVERARLKRPNFALTPENATLVAQLCHSLDGLPLAIELGAARVSVLSLEQIVARLGESLRLLTKGSQILLPRQQTLQGAIDWSYDLLSEDEQALFRGLSVFAGSFTLEAVEAACGGEIRDYETLDLLSQLMDKSLVVMEEAGGEARYHLLETIRQYAWGKLQASGEMEALRDRHLQWYLRLAERAGPELQGAEQGIWLERLEAEHDNLRAALRFSRENTRVRIGLRMAGALQEFWLRRGYYSEGREWLEGMLATMQAGIEPPGEEGIELKAARARALLGAGLLAYLQGDQVTSRAYHEEGLALSRELHDKSSIAYALRGLGHVAYRRGDYTHSKTLYEESLALSRESADRWGTASSLQRLGHMAYRQGDYARARTLQRESLAIFRELGDKMGAAISLQFLGSLALEEGDYAAARSLFEEGLASSRQVGDRARTGYSLGQLGETARLQGDYAAARSFYEQALAIYRDLGDKDNTSIYLHNLGHVAHREKDYPGALDLFRDSLAISSQLGNKQVSAWCLAGLAGVTATLGQPRRAAALFGAAEALLEAIGAVIEASDRMEYDRNMATARVKLSDNEEFEAAWTEGRALSMEQAIALAMEEIPLPVQPQGPIKRATSAALYPNELTKREVEVLRLVAEGLTDTQMAARLFLSPNTVHAHVTTIYSKLDVSTRAGAVRFAVEHGLI